MKKIRILAIILATSLLAASIAGCGKQSENEQETTTARSTTTAAGEAKDPDDGSLVEMVVVNSSGSDTLLDDTIGQKQVEKRWNVKLKAIRLAPDTAEEKLGALFAAGEKMDIIKAGQMAALVAQGVIGEINLEMIQTYMPKTWERSQNSVKDNGIENVADLLSVNGKIYSFPTIQESAKNNEWLRAFRKDILAEIGWTRSPETIAEYDEVFALVKAKHPDMYMLGGMGKSIYSFFAADIMGAYTQKFNTWMMYDGKVVNSCVAAPAKEYLAKVAEWFKLGYIDPEWFTDEWNTVFNKFAQGKTFSVIDYSGDLIITPEEFKEYQAENEIIKLKANFPDAEMVWAPPPKGPTGRRGNERPLAVITGAMVTTEFAKNTVGMIRFMKMMEGMNYDLEATLDWYGIEGEHYELYGSSDTPFLKWINGYDDAGKRNTVYPYPFYFLTYITGEFPQDSANAKLSSSPLIEWTAETWRKEQGYTAYDDASMIQINIPTVGSMPPEIMKIGNENPDSILMEYFDAIMIGTKPVEAFDEMVEKWNANGGKERTEWMNANAIKLK